VGFASRLTRTLVRATLLSGLKNPIEEAFSKVASLLRKAETRSRERLVEAMGRVISAVTARGAKGFFEHCGYRLVAQQLLQTL
jgi:transposase